VLVGRAGLDAGRKLAARITDSLKAPVTVRGHEVLISASVGIAGLTPAHQDAGALLSDADTAMYQSKRSGRGLWTTFEPGMRLADPVL
jgi:predicted signal transduction protein with EAL and GGDEF domain